MLFPYEFVNHPITKLQKWIDYLFIKVWCNAEEEYSLDLLNGCPELKSVAEEEAWKEDPNKRAKDYITGPIAVIYDLFKEELTAKQRKSLKKWYKRSRNIENICNGKKRYSPIKKSDFNKLSEKLSKELYTFYKNLYENVLGLATISNQNGTLEDHYKSFVKINFKGVCPFCGLNPIRSYEMKGHEAYDHYLPKESYPTYAVNFKNLVPTCHGCNSVHKFRNSPLVSNTKQKRKAFYPYSKVIDDIELAVKVNIKNYKAYEHRHIEINVTCTKENEKARTWEELYNIKARYKDELTNDGTGKYWLVKMIEELPRDARETEFNLFPKQLKNSKYRDKNFLKIPFLKACREEGIL